MQKNSLSEAERAFELPYFGPRPAVIKLIVQGGKCTFQILGVSGSEDRGGGDNSIQFINIGRVGDKSFKEWRQKIGRWKSG